MLVTKKFTFDSAHKLINYKGKCKNLHGHTYSLYVTIEGEVDKKSGMVIDFNLIKSTVNEKVIDILDHQMLNEIVKQPTAENLAIWIWSQIEGEVDIYEIKLWETPDSFVSFKGK
jgi:6-pyruvoyltetrahydropterin/6-carboxytetrahydropterin synthase